MNLVLLKLLKFYDEVGQQDSDFIVFMTRRAFVLNEIYLKNRDKDNKEPLKNENRFISCNAFLTKAKEIAEDFLNNKRFPSILICDEIMMHGRGIEKFLYRFERLVMEYIGERVNKKIIQMRLSQSIEIWVFAANKYGLLLNPVYQEKLHVKEYKSEFEIRQLSQKFSEIIIEKQEANISYVMSMYINEDDRKKLNNNNENWILINWKDEDWKNENHEENTFEENVFINNKSGFLQTVRFISDDTNQPLIALAIVDDEIINNVDLLSNKLIALFERNEVNDIIAIKNILRLSDKLKTIKVQLINFILSLFSMKNFIKDYEIKYDKNDKNNSFFRKKISSNFDFRGKLESEFDNLIEFFFGYSDSEIDREFESIFRSNRLYKISEEQSSREQTKRVSERIEDIFCELGLEAEWEANCVESGERWFEPLKIGFGKIGFFECFDRINSLSDDGRIELSYYIAGVLSLMDKGLISMNIEMEKEQVTTSLSAGERASLIWSERFMNFIPAFAVVEQEQWKFKMDMVKTMEKFVDELEPYSNDEKEIFSSLKRNIKTFTKLIGLSESSFQNLFYYYRSKLISMDDKEKDIKIDPYYKQAVAFAERNAVF